MIETEEREVAARQELLGPERESQPSDIEMLYAEVDAAYWAMPDEDEQIENEDVPTTSAVDAESRSRDTAHEYARPPRI